MVIYKDKADIENHELRYSETKKQFQEEVKAGIENRQGWAAATEIGGTTEGGLDVTQGYTFDILDGTTNRAITGEDLDQAAVNDIFNDFEGDTSFNAFRGQLIDPKEKELVGSEAKVNAIITENLEKIVSINDAQYLLRVISTGEAVNNKLPQNITFLLEQPRNDMVLQNVKP